MLSIVLKDADEEKIKQEVLINSRLTKNLVSVFLIIYSLKSGKNIFNFSKSIIQNRKSIF